ncbi:MAG: ATP synthase F1 subunit gamma [Elusimicrobia bacterium]|nr:ATP synthase F1 subunit gamma [Elusimicrobiota bacterium]
MASLRDIRRKINSVKSTEQITRAMKMVAAARMRRSQAAILAGRPFAVKMEGLIRDLYAYRVSREELVRGQPSAHDYFHAPDDGPLGLLLVTADKGLCGAFNTSLQRAALDWLSAHRGRRITLALVGRKGRDFMRRLRGFDFEVAAEMAGIFPKVGFQHAEVLGAAVLGEYFKKKLSRWDVIYNEFKSAAQQRLVRVSLLPLEDFVSVGNGAREVGADFGFEPESPRLLEALLPRYVKAQLYRILLESQAAELAARMNAMDSASKNAAELREALGVQFNRQRQAMITTEITELVGGAEALAA